MFGGMGIFGIPSYIGPNGIDKGFYGAIICIIVSFILGFLLMFFTKLEDDEEAKEEKKENTLVKQEILVSPLKGEVKPLSEVKDEAFSKGA